MGLEFDLFGNARKHVEKYRRGEITSKELWYKVNFVVVSSSHWVTGRKGKKGHKNRQAIRKNMWSRLKREFPELENYRIPKEINGHSRPRMNVRDDCPLFFEV
jgi:hypothetical protein